MIVIKVELHSANTGKVTEIGRAHFSNISIREDWEQRGDYDVEVMRRGSKDKVLRKARVNHFPRKNYNMWRLIIRGLRAAFPEEK